MVREGGGDHGNGRAASLHTRVCILYVCRTSGHAHVLSVCASGKGGGSGGGEPVRQWGGESTPHTSHPFWTCTACPRCSPVPNPAVPNPAVPNPAVPNPVVPNPAVPNPGP